MSTSTILPHSANLEYRSEVCCKRFAENTGRKNYAKNRHLRTIAQLCWAISSQLRYRPTIGKKLVKPRYLLYVTSQYGELRPTNGWNRLVSFDAPQQILTGFASWLWYCTDVLNGGQPNFAQCLAVSWLYIHFGGSCPLMEFCQVQNSLLPSLALTYIGSVTARHSSSGVSQTLRRGTRNGISELSLLVIFNRGRHIYSEGGHHVGHRPTF